MDYESKINDSINKMKRETFSDQEHSRNDIMSLLERVNESEEIVIKMKSEFGMITTKLNKKLEQDDLNPIWKIIDTLASN
jgi:hypothetical protein